MYTSIGPNMGDTNFLPFISALPPFDVPLQLCGETLGFLSSKFPPHLQKVCSDAVRDIKKAKTLQWCKALFMAYLIN